jgi:putative membrane protein (TIGR04086 family)
MKSYLKILGYTFLIIIVLTFLLTLLHYFNIINVSVVNIGKIVTSSVALILGGYKIGKLSQKRGWLDGMKFAGVIIILFLLMSLIFSLPLSLYTIIYYIILIVSSMFGGMLGISSKLKNKD